MPRESSEKYKLFRNYMVNELGVTRGDIEAWTKQSVATEVNKKLGQINVEKMVQDSISKSVMNSLGSSYSSNGLREAIAKEIVSKFVVTVASKL